MASAFQPDPLGHVLHAERTFFGTYKVRLDPAGEYRTLSHGTTLHGIQSIVQARSTEALSYYHPTGPLGDVFGMRRAAAGRSEVAVVGLGVGSVATYRRPEERWTFFEIDPAVEAIARNREYFSYLADCGDACQVIIGDARQSLAARQSHYGLIVLDAFSSDAIPVHLLTREALDVYLARLAPEGLLAFHVSNRHLDLEPVLAKIAENAGLVSYIRRDQVAGDVESGKRSSDWLVMASRTEHLEPLASDRRWRRSRYSPAADLWTDDFSNILTLLLRK